MPARAGTVASPGRRPSRPGTVHIRGDAAAPMGGRQTGDTVSEPNPKPEEEIVEYMSQMRAFAMNLTRNSAHADDLVQETVVKAWSNIDKFESGTNMRAWLFTILRNTHYSAGRKAKREVADVDNIQSEGLSEKPAHDGRLAMADFSDAFYKLTADQREALLLVGAAGYSYEEAAARCGCEVGTIKSRVNRGRRRLAKLLGLESDQPMELTDAATQAVVSNRQAV